MFLQIYQKITNSPLPQTKKNKTPKNKKKFQKLTINLINESENESRLDMGGVTF
jgi:hypothetical protein